MIRRWAVGELGDSEAIDNPSRNGFYAGPRRGATFSYEDRFLLFFFCRSGSGIAPTRRHGFASGRMTRYGPAPFSWFDSGRPLRRLESAHALQYRYPPESRIGGHLSRD